MEKILIDVLFQSVTQVYLEKEYQRACSLQESNLQPSDTSSDASSSTELQATCECWARLGSFDKHN